MLRIRTGRSGVASPVDAAHAVLTGAGSRRAHSLEDASVLHDAQRSLSVASDHLRSLQRPDGHWRGLLQTNVTMDAEDLLVREFLGVGGEPRTREAAAWIRSQQARDGSWANFAGGPGDLSTTIEAYWALRLAGDDPSAEHMERAAAFARSRGGPRAARVFTHIWMAMFGLWPWDEVPALPPELIFLPSWFPLNPYDFACWARQTVVALTIVRAHQPVHPLDFTLDELGPGASAPAPPARPRTPTAKVLTRGDAVLRVYERHPFKPLRRRALAAAERWVIQRQEADGGWGGIQPPWVYSLIALRLQGYPLDHPVMKAGLAGLGSFTVKLDGMSWLEACQSPVWDTALAILALAETTAPDDPDLIRATDWLLERQISDATGDWAVRRKRLAPGGWAFEYHNVNYPDIDDTAVIGLALAGVAHPDRERLQTAVDRAITWLIGMQSKDGGWGAFDADNARAVCKDLPFCDFGEVIDPPSADVTAHVVELLAPLERPDARASAERGLRWLDHAQETDGSWFGRWGVNHVYGTWSGVCALAAAGVPANDPRLRRATAWLEAHQNEDGGWGEDCRSYDDPAWIGRGESTASQTAWALLALHAAGRTHSPAAARGIRWLCATQRADGTWDEPQYTGTGFPGDFYINYHLYRLVFPVTALGRCLKDLGGPR
jgi:squalene-hopene/tetraprenyl-beta-curcumene cyclase